MSPSKTSKTMTLDQIPLPKRLKLGPPWDNLWVGKGGKGVTLGSVTLLGGIDKSTMAMQLAQAAVKKTGRPAVFILAGTVRPRSLQKTATKTGMPYPGVMCHSVNTRNWIHVFSNFTKPAIVIVDDFTSLCGQSFVLARDMINVLKNRVGRDAPVLLLCDMTKNGDYRGPLGLQHIADTLITIFPGDLKVARSIDVWKSRFGETVRDAPFVMTPHGLELFDGALQ